MVGSEDGFLGSERWSLEMANLGTGRKMGFWGGMVGWLRGEGEGIEDVVENWKPPGRREGKYRRLRVTSI